MTSQILLNSFIKGVGKTSGAAVTLFIGWQIAKLTYGHDDLVSFLINKKVNDTMVVEDVDMDIVDKGEEDKLFKKLFDGF